MSRFLCIMLLLAAALPLRAGTGDAVFNAWLRGLYGRRTVTVGEVLVAAAVLVDEAGWKPDHEWARGRLGNHARGVPAADQPATRGLAAQVFARTLGIRGGLWMHLTGSRRYAYRELVVLGLVPPGGESVQLNGDELAGLLTAACRYRDVGPERPPVAGYLQ